MEIHLYYGRFSIGNFQIKGFLVNPKWNECYPETSLLFIINIYSQNIAEIVKIKNMLLAHQAKDNRSKNTKHCQAETIKLKPQSRKGSCHGGGKFNMATGKEDHWSPLQCLFSVNCLNWGFDSSKRFWQASTLDGSFCIWYAEILVC